MTVATDPPLAGLRVLLVEDMASLRMVYRSILMAAGAEVRIAASSAEGRAQFRERPVPVVLLDLTLPDGDGLDLMRDLRALRSDVRVVVITAHGGVGRAVQAMRAGAHDFLVKPFDEDRLVAATRSAAQSLAAPGRRPRALAEGLGAMAGSSRAMADVALAITAAAPAMAPVLICGERGTGKTLAARMLHGLSGRSEGPFLSFDCSRISAAELERALFAEDGALYSPRETTLFLAELPALPLALQHRLLPLLHRTGESDAAGHLRHHGPIRLVAGCSEPPERALAEGRLDPGLLRVLDTLRIDLPPLRARGQDVVEIARIALTRFGEEAGKSFDGLSAPVETLLAHLAWPGNVTELLALMRNLARTCAGGVVTLDMLPPEIVPEPLRGLTRTTAGPAFSTKPPPASHPEQFPDREGAIHSLIGLSLAEIERLIIEATIAAQGGSLPRAARMLGLAPSTLYRKREGWQSSPAQDDHQGQTAYPSKD